MKDETEFYRLRIEEAERAFAAARLTNVRDQAAQARERWIELARQHRRALKEREKARLEKVARDIVRDEAAALAIAATAAASAVPSLG